MLLVDLDSPGVTVRPIRSADGGQDFSELFFDDVRVPVDRLIGRRDEGWSVAMYLLQWERGMYAWQRQASLHTELAAALATGGEPVHPAVAVGVGNAYRWLHALRLASRRTLERLSAGESPGPVISVDKILLATAEQAVFDVVRELSPFEFAFGDGPDADLQRADFVFSRAASIYGGAIEIQRSILADRILRLPREGS
jgi:alkylation response protein AidB-like acyl-CoA dehydrogenase